MYSTFFPHNKVIPSIAETFLTMLNPTRFGSRADETTVQDRPFSPPQRLKVVFQNQ